MKSTFQKYPVKKLVAFTVLLSLSLYAVLGFLFPGVLGMWEHKTLDLRFQFRHWLGKGADISSHIVQVNVDEHAYKQTGVSFWKRSDYAEVLEIVSAAGAGIIGSDIYFSGITDSLEDEQLIESFREAGNIVTPILFRIGESEGYSRFDYEQLSLEFSLPPTDSLPIISDDNDNFYRAVDLAAIALPGIWKNAAGIGFVNMFSDPDGIIRKYPLIIDVGGRAFPSFPLRTLCIYLNYPASELVIEPGKSITLKNVILPGWKHRSDLIIPIDAKGSMIINYVGTWEDGFEAIYSAGDIVLYQNEPELLSSEFADKIVIFAEVSNRSGDLGATPLESNSPKSAIYPNILNSILLQEFLIEADWLLKLLIFIAFIAIIIWLCISVELTLFAILYVILNIIYVGLTFLYFVQAGFILPVVSILVPSAAVFLYNAVFKFHYQERHRLMLEYSFKCYLPPALLRKIEENPDFLTLGGEKRDVVIFFSDIRKFARIAEKLPPKELVSLLNRYFSLMVEVAFKYDGTVDKFTGDEMMVVFGAPYSHQDDHLRALKMAFEMFDKLKDFNEEIVKEGHSPIKIGVGINYGKVIAGNIGSERKMDYSVIGDVINKAARIVTNAREDEIKISGSFYELVKDYVIVEKMEPFVGKPGEAPVQTYLLKAMKNNIEDSGTAISYKPG
ncbi:MAG: adenylate/guanylate cyclase domain-containing protein [candidate division Zixibacteria bacterium]|nr:adenylate/guanylate cyclase domain-containing protein [Candidatus Tariuqbacter arcticus]